MHLETKNNTQQTDRPLTAKERACVGCALWYIQRKSEGDEFTPPPEKRELVLAGLKILEGLSEHDEERTTLVALALELRGEVRS